MSDTTPRDQLAQIISDAENCTDEEGSWALPEDVADAILNAGWRPPARTVTTVEELDALPDGTMIRDSDPETFSMTRCGDEWFYPSVEMGVLSEYVDLPATVLYEPEEDA